MKARAESKQKLLALRRKTIAYPHPDKSEQGKNNTMAKKSGLWIFIFIFQHNLLLTLYTLPSVSPTFLSRLKSRISKGPQNSICLSDHLLVRREPLSAKIFFNFGNKKKQMAAKSGEYDRCCNNSNFNSIILAIESAQVCTLSLCKHGTHLAEIFFTPNFSCKINNTVPCSMPVNSTIFRTLIRQSLKIILWILLIISGVVTSNVPNDVHLCECTATLKLIYPIVKSCKDGSRCAITSSNSALISFGIKPFKCKCLITARNSLFPMFLNT